MSLLCWTLADRAALAGVWAHGSCVGCGRQCTEGRSGVAHGRHEQAGQSGDNRGEAADRQHRRDPDDLGEDAANRHGGGPIPIATEPDGNGPDLQAWVDKPNAAGFNAGFADGHARWVKYHGEFKEWCENWQTSDTFLWQ